MLKIRYFSYTIPLPPIMKKVILILISLTSIGVFACQCDPPKIAESYIQSDFVANVIVTKIYQNKKNEQGYRADIIITKLFKGEYQKSIYIYGQSDNSTENSCDINIPTNTKFIVYAEKNKEGNYGVGYCSRRLNLTENNLKKQQLELKILETFIDNKIHYTSKIKYSEKGDFSKPNIIRELQNLKGIELQNDFGFYEITFSSELTIKSVVTISGFNDLTDQKLINIFKNKSWESYDNGIKNRVPQNSKFIIGIHYYRSQEKNSSFLSLFY